MWCMIGPERKMEQKILSQNSHYLDGGRGKRKKGKGVNIGLYCCSYFLEFIQMYSYIYNFAFPQKKKKKAVGLVKLHGPCFVHSVRSDKTVLEFFY